MSGYFQFSMLSTPRLSPLLRGVRLCLTLIMVALLSSGARAESPDDVPNPLRTRGSWVADEANVISANVEDQLNQLIEREKKRTGCEIAVVTIRSLGDLSVRDFANELFNKWGIGEKSKDNGILMLAAIQDRKVRIEVGYGLESTLTDGVTGDIIRTSVVPSFKREQYGEGLLLATGEIVSKLGGTPPSIQKNTGNLPSTSNVPVSPPNPNAPPPSYRPNSSSFPHGIVNSPSSRTPSNINLSGGSTHRGFIFFFFLVGVACIWGIVVFVRNRVEKCSRCGKSMSRMNQTEAETHLSEVQKFEISIGSRLWEVWQCPSCANITIKSHNIHTNAFSMCPQCHNRTLLRQERVIVSPTQMSEGVAEVDTTCQWHQCGHHTKTQRTLSRLPPPAPVIVSSSSSDSWSSSSSSSSSDSSFSSSSSDFGGGSSGGGGADSSW